MCVRTQVHYSNLGWPPLPEVSIVPVAAERDTLLLLVARPERSVHRQDPHERGIASVILPSRIRGSASPVLQSVGILCLTPPAAMLRSATLFRRSSADLPAVGQSLNAASLAFGRRWVAELVLSCLEWCAGPLHRPRGRITSWKQPSKYMTAICGAGIKLTGLLPCAR